MTNPIEDALPWKPPEYAVHHVHAFRRLAAGTATEHDQKTALDFILHNLCGVRDLQYYPNSQRDTDFALGKAFVGKQIAKFLTLTPEQLRRLPNAGPDTESDPSRASEPASPKPRKRANATKSTKRKRAASKSTKRKPAK